MASSVEGIRAEMLRGIRVPKKIVNAALQKTYDQLDATVVKHVTYQGHVVSTVETPAHEVQAAASDRIFSLAGLYAREKDAGTATPRVAVEVDPGTGVIRLVVGSGPARALPP